MIAVFMVISWLQKTRRLSRRLSGPRDGSTRLDAGAHGQAFSSSRREYPPPIELRQDLRSSRVHGTSGPRPAVPEEKASSANPDLSPDARELLDDLRSVHGKRVLVGQQGYEQAERAFKASGRYPAILGQDLCGWSRQRWDDAYRRNIQESVGRARKWRAEGGIVTFSWHWPDPMGKGGDFPDTQPKTNKPHVGRMVTTGTPEHEAAMEDIGRHADYLEQLREARVPVSCIARRETACSDQLPAGINSRTIGLREPP